MHEHEVTAALADRWQRFGIVLHQLRMRISDINTNPPDRVREDMAVAAKEESGGRFGAVTDEEILAAQRFLAAREGVFVEPASAAGVAGLLGLAERGEVDRGQRIVVTVTGHGLKDIDTALTRWTPLQAEVVAAELGSVAAVCGLRG